MSRRGPEEVIRSQEYQLNELPRILDGVLCAQPQPLGVHFVLELAVRRRLVPVRPGWQHPFEVSLRICIVPDVEVHRTIGSYQYEFVESAVVPYGPRGNGDQTPTITRARRFNGLVIRDLLKRTQMT